MSSDSPCYFFKFGLIVTGETEAEHIASLFMPFTATGICFFEVIRKIGQRSPITSEKKILKMVGSGKTIPDKDADDIGFPARNYLESDPCSYVILIDDLENDRQNIKLKVFERYRQALDKVIFQSKNRASVHFLVNMVEAYYFAHADAVNQVLGTGLSDYEGDVEIIRHPKNELKSLYPGFDEKIHGGRILALLDIVHVLSCPTTCCSLRTLFSWCLNGLKRYPDEAFIGSMVSQFSHDFCFDNGCQCEVIIGQSIDSGN